MCRVPREKMKTERELKSIKKNQKIKEKIFDIFFHACLQEFKVDVHLRKKKYTQRKEDKKNSLKI
jgi:hypothetical protein